MKSSLLTAVFAALFTTSSYAHPRIPETLQFKVSIDVSEVTEQPPTYAVLFFEGALFCPTGNHYTITAPVNGAPIPIGKLSLPLIAPEPHFHECAKQPVGHERLCSPLMFCFPLMTSLTTISTVEPTIEVQNVTLHGFANCTIYTDTSKEYDLVSYGIPPTINIDPPAVFVSVNCSIPNEGDDAAKHWL